MTGDGKSRAASLAAFIVVAVAAAGYFTGLQSPMKVTASNPTSTADRPTESTAAPAAGVVLAPLYNQMASVTLTRRQHSPLESLKSAVDPLAEIHISPQEKLDTLKTRELNRAFNGAPPTIPHPIDQRSDASCVACHQAGAVTKTLRIPRMSHAVLAGCTQCHVENSPPHMPVHVFFENEFTGLKAPTAGPRAFAGAPPQIPHSTWMRSDCMSCHGYQGAHGIRTTHPWRSNCQQCHTPSATMDQTLLIAEPQFLPGPEIRE